MRNNIRNSHFRIRIILLFLCIIGILVLTVSYVQNQKDTRTKLKNVTVRTQDDKLFVSWTSPSIFLCDKLTMEIYEGDELFGKQTFSPLHESYLFTEGQYGKVYTFALTASYRDGKAGDEKVANGIFLDFDHLPDLPLVQLETFQGKNPKYKELDGGELGYWGVTQTKNDYVSCTITIEGAGMHVSDSARIRTRGNSSCIWSSKKPYKIVLDHAANLLDSDVTSSQKEWVLLNNGDNLKTYIGDYLGDLVGMEWQPHMRFVNVLINGDWRGVYCLTEAVSSTTARNHISDSGYFFENDAYFWNADDLYFQTDNQTTQMGYTFKYPAIMDLSDPKLTQLKDYWQTFENAILAGDPSYKDYIDEEAFAKWLLARDIAGTADGGGSNMYFYKYDFDPQNPTSTKVKMGPLWDFDRIYETTDEWSYSRSEDISYFPQLFEQPSFSNTYSALWDSIKDTLYQDVEQELNHLERQYGTALTESWSIETLRRGESIPSFTEQKADTLNWFSDRITWINQNIQ